MSEDPLEIIDKLKVKLGAETDVELARKLRIEKSTISSWKARGRVPGRFVRILAGDGHTAFDSPPIGWGEEEKAAFSLALFRFSRAYADIVAKGEYRELMPLFQAGSGHFWWLMSRAQKALIERQERNALDINTAKAMVIFDDLTHGSGAVERDRAGPWLSGGPFEGRDKE